MWLRRQFRYKLEKALDGAVPVMNEKIRPFPIPSELQHIPWNDITCCHPSTPNGIILGHKIMKMMIKRTLNLESRLERRKVLILNGARQVGKKYSYWKTCE